jgi:hypothetical protein
MKAFVLTLAVLFTVNCFAFGLLQIPECCMQKGFCPMHHQTKSAKPSCHGGLTSMPVQADNNKACFRSCDSIKRVTTAVHPAVLPEDPEVPYTLIYEAIFVPLVSAFANSALGTPDQPPRISFS